MRPVLRALLAGALILGVGACSFAGRIHFGDAFLLAGGDGFVTTLGHHVGIVLH